MVDNGYDGVINIDLFGWIIMTSRRDVTGMMANE